MLEINQIESFFPESLRPFKRNILREYLQHKILEIIYDSPFGNNLVFMGGTAIHIVHGNPRFSEDLDFDNRGLRVEEAEPLKFHLERRLSLEGWKVTGTTRIKKAIHIDIRFHGLLHSLGISPHPDEICRISLDIEPQNFPCHVESFLLNRFDVFLRLKVMPADVLLAQKIVCLFKRKRSLGRDFHDVIFLSGKTRSNPDYLNTRLHIQSDLELHQKLHNLCRTLDFKRLADDVRPFLYPPQDVRSILSFLEWAESVKFL